MKYGDIYALDRKVRALEMRILRAKTKEERDTIRMEMWTLCEIELVPDPRPSLYQRLKDFLHGRYAKIRSPRL